MEIDFGKKCRACLNEDDQKRDIFVEFEHGITLQEILQNTTNFEVTKDDGLSPFMCHSCTNTVVDFYHFKNLYQTIENKIRALLAANIEVTKNAPGKTDNIEEEKFAVQENTEPALKEIKLEVCPDLDLIICENETGYHSETKTHDSPDCDESFLNENVSEHHSKNKLAGEICKNSDTDPPAATNSEPAKSKTSNRTLARSKIIRSIDSRVVCPICNSTFKRKCDLNEHMDIHLDERIHVCEICQKTFKRRTVLAKHRRLHTQKKTMISQNSTSAKICENETGYHSETRTHDSPNCDESFLNENVSEHLLKNTLVGEICNNSATDPPAATNSEPAKNETSNRTLARSKIKIQEDVEYWGDSRVVCPICNSTFKRRCDLKEHMDIHLDERIHVCEICQKTFKRRTVLAKHRRLHTQKIMSSQNSTSAEIQDDFVATTTNEETENCTETFCKICNESFDSHQLYKKHAKCHNTIICHECGSKFKRKCDLNEHMTVHLSTRIFKCELCPKSFKRKTVWINHRRIHTNPREQLCTFCGKAFTFKSTLRTHIQLCHVKSRDYACVICNARFPLKSTLDRHVRRHQERRNEFQCKQCSAAYKESSSLNRHVLVKHTQAFVKSSCDECHKEFACVGSLNRHMKKVHGRAIDSTSDLRDGSGNTGEK